MITNLGSAFLLTIKEGITSFLRIQIKSVPILVLTVWVYIIQKEYLQYMLFWAFMSYSSLLVWSSVLLHQSKGTELQKEKMHLVFVTVVHTLNKVQNKRTYMKL